MAAGARAALRALLALLCCGAPCAVGGVALRPRAGPGDVKVPRVRLPGGGGAMPMAGLGLPKCEPDAAVGGDCREKARNATLEFLLLGGRLLDTALAYENHRAVGAAIREAVDRHGVRREVMLGRLVEALHYEGGPPCGAGCCPSPPAPWRPGPRTTGV
ncbi:unnamed protein product [Prorocentrum cordatum]|uniref:NADP-dependent oxidoreductase domain-containing protein n=1 Tax=Prorocentrum cordatum TaxID=2364126 RepID=A0ABN9Q8I7_9DINO|nr:unnamed protein product [Polarella glacialis]